MFQSHAFLSRRSLLAGSAAAHLALNLAPALANGPNSGRAKSVILIFNCGAPSHLDLFDMKPLAPEGIRGPFKPIDTNVPGIQFSELMPSLTKHADKLAIVRTLHHKHHAHNSGMYWSIVGRPYTADSTLINPSRSDYPSFGTLVGWLARRDGYSSPLPPYVITPAPHCDSTKYITPGQYGACLGPNADPYVLNADPNGNNFAVPEFTLSEGVSKERLALRKELLTSFSPLDPDPNMADYSENANKALSLISNDEARKAFDLSSEPESVSERYGRHTWGQSHLLARRLVEAGVPFVSTVNGQSIIWDTHEDNANRLKTKLVPPMEKAFSALLDDLEERGLLETTLVVWMGDFGRTPVINAKAGRDHWPYCYSMVLAGGGIRGGQVYGESDKTGAYPKTKPTTPADIHATILSLLGYDPHGIHYETAEGRPVPLSEGTIIPELI